MEYEDLKKVLKDFLMNTYDIRPSLAESTIAVMFVAGVNYISEKEQVVRGMEVQNEDERLLN